MNYANFTRAYARFIKYVNLFPNICMPFYETYASLSTKHMHAFLQNICMLFYKTYACFSTKHMHAFSIKTNHTPNK